MLTNKQLDNLKPRGSAYRVWDGNRSGFGARITPNGTVSFFQFYSIDGRRRFYSLGKYPDMKLTEARKAARELRLIVERGNDPRELEQAEREAKQQAEAERKRQADAEARRGSFGQLLKIHIEKMHEKGRTGRYIDDFEATIRRFTEHLMAEKVSNIGPRELAMAIADPIKRGRKHTANRLHTYLHSLFQTALHHDHDPANIGSPVAFGITHNPVTAIPKQQVQAGTRDRALDWHELGVIFRTIDDPAVPGSPVTRTQIKLQLLLAGMHFSEVGWARWDEINFMRRVWDIPRRRGQGMAGTKNARPHVLPLMDWALAEVQWLHRLTGHTEWLFPNARDESRPIGSTTPAQWIRKILRPAMAERGHDLEPWSPANFRSTVKTRLAELGFTREQRNRLQNHAQTGVDIEHYDRWDYLDEKREMLACWELALQRAMRGESVDPKAIREAV